MSDHILYNFGANYTSIDDINGHFADLQRVHEDIQSISNTIQNVYEGDGAAAMVAKCGQISAMLDTAISDANHTSKSAQIQNEFMQSLDKHNAAQF